MGDNELQGCTEEELLLVQELRDRTPQLEGHPEHITDQMNLLRFLRGFGGLEEATVRLHEMLVWRAENQELLQAVAACTPAGLTSGDTNLLPGADKLTAILPLRYVQGNSLQGLPLNCVYVGQIDLARFGNEVSDEEFLAFITSFVEQRAIVLHNLKATHPGLLVKSVEVRDLDMLSVTTFMASPRLIKRIKNVMGRVQSNFPETSHQIHIVHPGATFSTLFALISTFMNERQLSKIRVNSGNVVQALAGAMDCDGICSYVQLRGQMNGSVHLEKGERKYIALRLNAPSSARLNTTMTAGGDTTCELAFVSETGEYSELWKGKVGKTEVVQEVELGAGVVVFTLDNSSSWWGSADLDVNIVAV